MPRLLKTSSDNGSPLLSRLRTYPRLDSRKNIALCELFCRESALLCMSG